MISFGSVCSGIEAASVAWGPLGWRAAWLAEIEAFPAAVLAHHYPEVPNLGDMTQIAAMVRAGLVEAPDVLCGGTPCQAFSVAGLRRSLDDARGNLSLTFCELANDIDTRRKALGKPPAVVFWENVPGVLTTRDNAFGCFLASLAGESDPLHAPGGKWAHAGVVLGPQRTVAWRILDAQYFGVAQRRRRVFVVASARAGFDPAAVLFEFHGVRRDTAPRREAEEDAAAGTLRSTDGGIDVDHVRAGHVVGPLTAACGPNGHGGSGLATDKGAEAGHILAFGGNRTSGSIDITPALLAQPGSGWKGDFESETFLVQPTAYAIQAGALRTNPDSGPNGVGIQQDHAYTLEARAEVQCVAFDTPQVTSSTNRSNPQPGDPCHPLAAGAHPPAIAFSSKDYGADATEELAPTLRAMNHAESHPNGGGQMAVAFHGSQDPDVSGDVTHPVGRNQGQETCVAVALRGREGGATAELGDEVQNCLRASSGGGDKPHVLTAMQVRRLTPVECERLQGFPDNYTAIPWRKKPASECPDGPRYKALGNSWAVPVVAWLGERIYCEILTAMIWENAA